MLNQYPDRTTSITMKMGPMRYNVIFGILGACGPSSQCATLFKSDIVGDYCGDGELAYVMIYSKRRMKGVQK